MIIVAASQSRAAAADTGYRIIPPLWLVAQVWG